MQTLTPETWSQSAFRRITSDNNRYRERIDDPFLFAEKYLKILNKAGELVPLVYNTPQRDFIARRGHRDLVLKARQMGFSTAIQAELYRRSLFQATVSVTLAHEFEATQKLRRMADRFHNNMPDGMRPARQYSNARFTSYPDTGSEALIATAGNKQTGRAGTYTHVHASEAAYYDDAESIMAGLMQGGNPDIVLESTPNGAQGYFYNLCMEALDGANDWRLFFYPWWSDPTYQLPMEDGETIVFDGEEAELVRQHGLSPEQIKWRRVKKRELKHLFAQEYPEDVRTCFLQSGIGYFGDLSACFGAPLSAVYDPDHRYVAGLDFGQTNDFTVLIVLDVTAGAMVDMLRLNQLSWAEMRRRIALVCQQWHVRVLCPEKNSIGSVNIEELHGDFKTLGCETRIAPFVTSNLSKANMMAELHEDLHSGALHLQNVPVLRAELAAFSMKQTATGAWALAAKTGHDDTVMGLGTAHHAARHHGAAKMVPTSGNPFASAVPAGRF